MFAQMWELYFKKLFSKNFTSFKKKVFLADTFTCPFLGPLVSLFWISGDVSSWFRSQSEFCFSCIEEANVMHTLEDPPVDVQHSRFPLSG